MARKKQPNPTRPKRPIETVVIDVSDDEERASSPIKRFRKTQTSEAEKVIWRNIVSLETSGESAKEVAEVNLLVTASSSGYEGITQDEKENSTVRVRVQLRSEGRKGDLGFLQEVSKHDLKVQILMFPKAPTTVAAVQDARDVEGGQNSSEDSEDFKVLMSGEIDGPDSAVAALAYLIRQGFCGLRTAPCLTCSSSWCWDHSPSGRLRVIISKQAFTGTESFSPKPFWKRAMQTVMPWLRPELVFQNGARSVRRYDEEITENFERLTDTTASANQHVFDPAGLYDAVKPSWSEPGLRMSFPELLPDLRPYQRRAAFWMVQRERGLGGRFETKIQSSVDGTNASSNHQAQAKSLADSEMTGFSEEHPLWFSILPLDGTSEFFFNPYSGAVSLEPQDFVSYVNGGILADEMGLGKTVELLACILANPYRESSSPNAVDETRKLLHSSISKRKRERVECSCGVVVEDDKYTGSWVACDVCDAWQHATCVGYARPAELKVQGSREPTSSKRQRTEGSETTQGAECSQRRDLRKESSVRKRSEGSNRRKDSTEEEKFVCGGCAELIGSAEVNGDCKATLVVCPAAILQQWQDEIKRHTKVGFLRVMVYEGVGKGAFVVMDGKEAGSDSNNRLKVVSAHDLAEADIVLTTYDTLRTDLNHNSDKTKSDQRSMRFMKRYRVIPTPLTRLRWWRVCLDEAQMVESPVKATEMALLLDSQNRWCVTGTPIQRGLDDLFGLLRFLKAEPFDEYQNWKLALRQPYENGDAEMVSYMHKFLGSLMWRSTKVQVKDELNLPAQEQRLSRLRFSPVEAHFYRQQHEKCAVKARALIAKYGLQRKPIGVQDTERTPVPQTGNSEPSSTQNQFTTSPLDDGQDGVGTPEGSSLPEQRSGNHLADADRPLSHSEFSGLFSSLLRLRQACCHPQVGTSGVQALQQQSPMTMDEILQVLVDKAKIEAEEAQRVLMGALNGLAALAAIESDFPLAVSIYREALAMTEENAAEIDVDPLQKLHTLHNLAEVLEVSSGQASRHNVTNTEVASSDTGVIPEAPSVLENSNGGQSTVNRKIGDDANPRTGTGIISGNATDKPHPTAVPSLLGSKIPQTLRDDLLIKQCQEIRSKYMASFELKLAQEQAKFEHVNLQVGEAKRNCEASGGMNWWLGVLSTMEKGSGTKDLVNKIRAHLLETDNLGKRGRHRNASSLALMFRETSGLKYVMQRELDAIESARTQVLERLKSQITVMSAPTAKDVEGIISCPRHSENTTGALCAHCEMDDLFQIYENRLLLLQTSADGIVSAEDAVIAQQRILAHRRISGSGDRSGVVGNDFVRNTRGGTGPRATETQVLRAPSEVEQILTMLKGYAKVADRGRIAATKHLHVFEVLKKECFQMRALAKIQRELLYSLDELKMATTRLTLKLPGEVVETELENLVKLPAEEVPQRNVQLTSEKFDALKDFSRAKGQLRYLKGLSVASRLAAGKAAGPLQKGWHHIADETCPVCQDKLGLQLMVLPCGHLLCCKCCMHMVERTPIPPNGIARKRIGCPTCRQRTYVGDIALVDSGKEKNGIASQIGQLEKPDEEARADEEASLWVKGSYGTKIEAVVRRLLWVQKVDTDAKVLVFSTWNEVLDVMEHALLLNRIRFARVKGAKLDAPIAKFRGVPLQAGKFRRKREMAPVTEEPTNVLLLPIQRGGNGLNLVEAQHVILVEALPNPAVELQVINRVHRIGQTRATCVHRFIVNDTVEESVYWLGRSKAELAEKFPAMIARKRDQFSLTISDVSALFAPRPAAPTGDEGHSSTAPESFAITLPPAAAAAAAAEARLRMNTAAIQVTA